MIIKPLLPFLILISVINYSCKSSESVSDADRITSIFSNYIQETFPNVILKDTSIFILIPKRYCTSCQKLTNDLLVNTQASSNIYIIARTPSSINVSENHEILIDKKGLFEKLDLGVGSVAFIVLKNNKVDYITEISQGNHEKIMQQFEQYYKTQ